MPGRALRAGEESVGQIKFFSADPGAGWLLCDGNAVSKTRYPELVGLLDEGMAQTALPIFTNAAGTFSFAVNGEVHICKTRGSALTNTSITYSSDGVNFTDYTGVKTALEAKLMAQYGGVSYSILSAFLIHDGAQYVWFIDCIPNATSNEQVYVLTATTPSGTWTVQGSHRTIGDGTSPYSGISNAGYIPAISTYWYAENSGGVLVYGTNLTTWFSTSLSAAHNQVNWDGSQFIIGRPGTTTLYGSDPASLSAISGSTYFAVLKGLDGFYGISGSFTGDAGNPVKASTINGTYSAYSGMLTNRGLGYSRIQNVMYHPLVGTIMQQGGSSTITATNNTLLQTKTPGDQSSYRRLETRMNYAGQAIQGVFEALTVSGGFAALSPQTYANGGNASIFGTAIFRYGLVLPNITPIGDGRKAYIRVYR